MECMRVYSETGLNDLLSAINHPPHNQGRTRSFSRPHTSHTSLSIPTQTTYKSETYFKKWKETWEADEAARKRSLITNRKRDHSDFEASLHDILHTRTTLKECDSVLNRKQREDMIRKKRLYHSWNDKVYNNIQNRIKSAVTWETFQTLKQERQKLHDEYIRKAPTHDPYRMQRLNQRIRTTDLEDPLKSDLAKLQEEHDLLQSGTDMFNSKTRYTLDPIEYTVMHDRPGPKDEMTVRKIQAQPIRKYSSGGDVMPDHYNPPGGISIVKGQYFPGGKYIPDGKSCRQKRSHLRTCDLA